MNKFTLGMLCLISGLLLSSVVQCKPGRRTAVESTTQDSIPAHERGRAVSPVTVISTSEEATIKLFEEAAPSVVYITTTAIRQDYWSRNIYEIPAGTGSGFVWDEQGHIVTNYHVIKDAYKATVTFSDQSTYEAEVAGYEPSKDLAVLRIKNARQLRPLPIGTSHNLRVGQSVFAIGNPFGLDQTLTTGVISALGREIQSLAQIPIRDVIQTDAAINPGNSGGPLLDISGRLIGVNTAIYSPSGTYAGIGFSVPVDIVNWVVPDLIKYGEVRRPVLGIEMLQQQYVDRMNLKGALVMDIVPGSPAEKSGLKATRRSASGEIIMGDLITQWNDIPIQSSNDLLLTLEKYKPGEEVQLTVKRNNETFTLSVILGSSR